jgi:SnoaL-like domain
MFGTVVLVAGAVESLMHEYTRRYTAYDADGVTELCLWPFMAIREGVPIHLADREAVRDHFLTIMDAYRDAGYADFSPVEIDTRHLGERAAFTTVRWHALDTDGNVARDTLTTYHLLASPAGWRFLSYTNHF